MPPTLYAMQNSRTPFGPGEEAALNHLEQYVNATADDERLTRETAVTQLMEHGAERADARAHIKQLLLKGYLYEVDDELRIPSRP